MHTPSTASARPLPKRTRSTAGLEEIDAWLGQITSAAPSPPLLSATPTPFVASGASRKRHHSLPTTAISGSLRPPTSTQHSSKASNSNRLDAFASPASTQPRVAAQAAGRRPDLALYAGEHQRVTPASLSSSPFSSSTTSLARAQRHSVVETSYSPPPSLQPPEMSPREDYLVRAFVSDVLKLEGSGSGSGAFPSAAAAARPPPPPLQLYDLESPRSSAENASKTPTPRHGGATPSHHKWTREEDEKLRDAVSRFGGKSWKLIAEMLGHGRTDVQCLHRWNKVLKPGLVKGPWTPEEDRILLGLIARHGVGQIRWCDVALHLPGRIGKQCRERWCNHLDSSIRKGQWTPEEDDTVFRLQQSIGNKWSEIAKQLPGRTENAVKNRFNSAARRKWLMAQAARHSSSSSSSSHPGLSAATMAARTQQHRQDAPATPAPAFAFAARAAPPQASAAQFTAARANDLLSSSSLLAGPPRPPHLHQQQQQQQQQPAPLFRGAHHFPLSFASLDAPSGFRAAETVSHHPPVATGYFRFGDDQPQQPQPAYSTAASQQLGFPGDGGDAAAREARLSFGFHAGQFRPPRTTSPPGLASLSALLSSSPSPESKQDGPENPFGAHDDAAGGGGRDGDRDGDGGGFDTKADDAGRSHDNQVRSPVAATSRRRSFKERGRAKHRPPRVAAAEPQVDDDDADADPQRKQEELEDDEEDDDDDDDDELRSLDLPDDEQDAHDGGQGQGSGSPSAMDENMSTFLDSVALELDDMI